MRLGKAQIKALRKLNAYFFYKRPCELEIRWDILISLKKKRLVDIYDNKHDPVRYSITERGRRYLYDLKGGFIR